MYKENLNKTNEKKICFIICSNNKYYLEECIFYISQLEIPIGYSVDVLSIQEAKSMASGYNEGMKATDARYKVYLHQDTFITYKRFLQSVLDIFSSDTSIGMIGMVGTPKMSVGGVMWYGHREGQLYGINETNVKYDLYHYKLEDGLYEVEAIDGFIMITKQDIKWREDIFDGWDFYDVSHSFEFRKKGFKVVVPEQLSPWCMHMDGILNFANYNKYRKICVAEYPQYFNLKRFQIGNSEKKKQAQEVYVVIIARNQFELLKRNVQAVKALCGVEESQIIVIDNGSEDGLRHWLKYQKSLNYIICEEVIESFAAIVNEVIKQFVVDEDILILNAELVPLPGCMEKMMNNLRKNEKTGGVCGKIIGNNSQYGKNIKEVAEYVRIHEEKTDEVEISRLHYEGVLIRNELLKVVDNFNEKLFLPKNTMQEMSLQGKKKQYFYYEISNAFFYKIEDNGNIYEKRFDKYIDGQMMHEMMLESSGERS